MALPPVTQTFIVNATDFLAGIDDMLAGLGRLEEQINAVSASTERLAGSTAPLITADDDLAASLTAVTDSLVSVDAQMAALDATMADSIAAVDANTAAIDANSASKDANAGSSERAGTAAAGFGRSGVLAFLGVGAAVAYGVVKASEFQTGMERLHTQAGVLSKDLPGLSHGVLQLSSNVGFGPASLSSALYHIESSFQSVGITGPKALNLLKIAAEGAQVGGSDLVDTTNALDATIAANIPGIHNYSQAMGALNAIVGTGDMTMQDLADAMGTGLMAAAHLFGQNITQVGAALATLGDNNIRGAKAATDLRMTWQAIQAPMKAGIPILQSLGLSSTALADTMTHHGLTAAIGQFITHLNSSKVPIQDWGQMVTEIFGKRAGVGIGVLIDQYDRLKSKIPDLERSTKNFGSAWGAQAKTMSQQWHDLLSGVEALAVRFGTMLLPAVTKVVGEISKFFGWLEKHPAFAAIVGGIIAITAALGGLTLAFGALDAMLTIPNLIAVGLVVLGVAIYEAYRHSVTFRDAIRDVANFFRTVWNSAVHIAGDVIKWFVNGPLAFIKQQLAVFSAFWKQNGAEITKIAKAVWQDIWTNIKVAWDLILGVTKAAFDILSALFKGVWESIVVIVKTAWYILATVISSSIRAILDIISVVLDLIQGHWSAAWGKLKDLFSTVWNETKTVISDLLNGFVSVLYDIGSNLIKGLINGIKSMISGAISAVKDVAHGIVSGIKDVLGIFSPSRVFYQLGTMITAGLSAGIVETTKRAEQVARELGRKIRAAYRAGEITGAQATELEGRIETELKDRKSKFEKFVNELGLTINRILVRSLSMTPGDVKSAMDKLLTDVRNAWKAGDITYKKAKELTSFLESDNHKLEDLASRRAKILKTIATAQKYAASTTQNVESWASLSNAVSSLPQGGGISGAGMLASLQQDLATIKQFNAAIKKLAALGLNKNLLNQIIQAGPTDGLQMAEALLAGPVSTIKQLSSTEAQIESASTSIGKVAANAMYDTGKVAGKGFLSGLEAQEKNIQKEMDKIVDGMLKHLDKALGIHTGESEPKKRGKKIAKDIADGIDAGWGLVGSATDRLLGTNRLRATGGSGSDGGDTHYHVDMKFDVQGLVTGTDAQLIAHLQPVIQKAILQLEKRNPTPQTTRSRAA